MRGASFVLCIALSVPLIAPALGNGANGGIGEPHLGELRALSVRDMVEMYADDFPVDPLPEGLDAQEANRYIIEERDALGRTPMEWVEWVNDAYTVGPADAPETGESGDLVTSMVDLYDAMGLPVTAADDVHFRQARSAVPPDVRGPLADLVTVIAGVYREQAAVVEELTLRLEDGFDVRETFVTVEEREEMALRAARIVDAINVFWARTEDAFDVTSTAVPVCLDPECLVILGTTGPDVYTQGGTGTDIFPDPVLVVDPDGDDDYLISAGGADPTGVITLQSYPNLPADGNGLVVSVVADLLGNDDYLYDGPPSAVQGAGSFGGIGILADATGNDKYLATMRRDLVGPTSTFLLAYFEGGGQGHGYAGIGLLLDGLGNDIYDFDVESVSGRCIWAEAQGFGGLGGLGVASDGAGTDQWLGDGLDLQVVDDCWGPLGGGTAFLGMYIQGVGFYGGVGIMTDTGLANDIYNVTNVAKSPDYYSQGFGAFGGVGIMFDDGGDDDYWAYEEATSATLAIDPILNCAYGTGFLGAVGVFIDLAGNDEYRTHSVPFTGHSADTMAEGWAIAGYGAFLDAEGDDRHIMTGTMTAGRGENLGPSLNTFSSYVDGGGSDVYVGPPSFWVGLGPGPNNSVWAGGADLPLVP